MTYRGFCDPPLRLFACEMPTKPRPPRVGEVLVAVLATTPYTDGLLCPGWSLFGQRTHEGHLLWYFDRVCTGNEGPQTWRCDGRVVSATVLVLELTDSEAHAADPTKGVDVVAQWWSA